METLLQDMRYGARQLMKNRAFTAVAVIALALGIGANSAIFSVINGVLLRPLPYPEPSRLMFITSQFPTLGFPQFWVSVPEFLEFRERNRSFEEVGGYRAGAVNLGTADQPRRVNSALVTADAAAHPLTVDIRGTKLNLHLVKPPFVELKKSS